MFNSPDEFSIYDKLPRRVRDALKECRVKPSICLLMYRFWKNWDKVVEELRKCQP